MFSHKSRYANLADLIFVATDGREYVYKQRRLPPTPSEETIRAHVRPKFGERLDQIAAQTLGDPLQFWMIADANDALNPVDPTETDDPIAIPGPRIKTP